MPCSERGDGREMGGVLGLGLELGLGLGLELCAGHGVAPADDVLALVEDACDVSRVHLRLLHLHKVSVAIVSAQ